MPVTQAEPGGGRSARNLRRAGADRGQYIADVEREVFGPVLHVLRYRREGSTR